MNRGDGRVLAAFQFLKTNTPFGNNDVQTDLTGGLTRRSTCRGPASVRRPSRLVKSKSERRRAACIARLTCVHAVRRAALATWALAAQVNV